MDIIDPMKVTDSNPWEDRRQIGFLKAVWQTIKKVITKPDEFFGHYHPGAPLKDPFIFYYIISITTTFISHVTFALMPGVRGGLKPGTMILQVIFTAVLIFIIAGFAHVFVLMFRGKGGYRGTFHVMAYSCGATVVFTVVPVLGPMIAGCLGIVLSIIGYKQVHRMSTGKAVAAYLLSFFAGIALVVGVIGTLIIVGKTVG